ncbi:unnamed protein product [Lactuca saligna]|uniref:Reverse transcriptase zinc-binding domain-containing protein n=1 Tax=Lactuca saligna TaxID=75948 RepID=A0AA35Z3H6_LACSI|nr:unnamed protein product [Lactuca saligna]
MGIVDLLRSKIENKTNINESEPRISWVKLVPIKVSTFIWRANMGSIPSAIELSRRGMMLSSTYCSLCISGEESCDYLLIKCPYATEARNLIFQWCNINSPQLETVGDTIQFVVTWGWNVKKKEWLTAICYGLVLCLWKAGNDRIFKVVFSVSSRIVNNIKSP